MNEVLQKLMRSVFSKDSVDECELSDIKTMIGNYSYFAAPQYFLSEKLEGIQFTGRKEQLRKCSLYFNNPLWFNYLLRRDKYDKINKPASNTKGELLPEPEDPYNDEIVYENKSSSEAREHVTDRFRDLKIEIIPETKERRDFIFEPYHTVDYFASQGIRHSEERPRDKFGHQLKSFTEWLKAMKKLPESEFTKTLTVAAEAKVVSLAEHSLDNKEVVTETMAELWIRQDQPEKAIEIYRKLSLLEPSKSGYFASLIKKLKESI